jgi:predicted NAD-dependent protein-ADP-ribosyltransferase YbiA (DUF1768 family)
VGTRKGRRALTGLAANDPRAEKPEQRRGLNLLGFALMEARRLLLDAAAP